MTTLFRTSLAFLQKEPKLLLFPLSSALLIVLLMVFILFPREIIAVSLDAPSAELVQQEISTGKVFLFLVLTYFIIMFSNASTVITSSALLQRQKPHLRVALSQALQDTGKLFRWAIIAAIPLGLVLRYLGTKSRQVSHLLFPHGGGEAWDLLTYFALPVMILEGKDIHQALHESRQLIRTTWKKALRTPPFLNPGSIMLIGVGLLILLYGLYSTSFPWKMLGLIYTALTILFFSTLAMIVRTALYLYAQERIVSIRFSQEELQEAFPCREEKKETK